MTDNQRKRIFDIIQIGNDDDLPSRAFDIGLIVMILINLFIAIFETFEVSRAFANALNLLEFITVLAFTAEYALRIWTADYLFPKLDRSHSMLSYVTSFSGIIDLLSFLPYYLPVFFPAGIVAFRMFRVVRIFRLFRINAYYDALNVITDVVRSKKDQLLSSIFIILVLMVAASLCMYSLEHDAQPDVFTNAFSGFWWAVSSLLTVGYGDIYPVTIPGKIFGIAITFLGVGMVAIPTGILSAGFVEQYTRIRTNDYSQESNLRFVRLPINHEHPWIGQHVHQIQLPAGILLAAVQRGDRVIPPRDYITIQEGDRLVLGAEGFPDDTGLTLKELTLKPNHRWIGSEIQDLDISRQTIIVLVERNHKGFVPNGRTVLEVGDTLLMYSRHNLRDTSEATPFRI